MNQCTFKPKIKSKNIQSKVNTSDNHESQLGN